MTVVRPNSIAGINSITVQTGQALNVHDASGNLIRSLTSSSGVSTYQALHIGSGTTTSTQGISVGTGCSIVSGAVNTLQFFTNSNERFRIDSSGHLHTGYSSNVTGADHVNILASDGGGVSVAQNNDGDATSGTTIGSYSFQGYHQGGATFASAEARISAIAAANHTGSSAATDLAFYTKIAATGPGSSPTEKLRITSTGRLDILGDGQNGGFTLSNAYGQAGFFGGMYFNGSSWTRNAIGGRIGAGICVYTGGHIAFLTSTENSGTSATMAEKIRVGNGGNLNIGVTGNAVGGAPSSGEGKVNIYHTGAGANDWALQVRQDSGSNGNGIFVRAGNGASRMALDVRGYDETNKLLQVNGAGYVTMPQQPAWSMRPSYSSNQTLGSGYHAIGWSTADANTHAKAVFKHGITLSGSNWGTNVHNGQNLGKITVPVAGRYFVYCTMRQENQNNAGNLYLYVDGSQVARQHVEDWNDDAYIHGRLEMVVNLDANSYIMWALNNNGGIFSGTNDTVNWCGGYLIG